MSLLSDNPLEPTEQGNSSLNFIKMMTQFIYRNIFITGIDYRTIFECKGP